MFLIFFVVVITRKRHDNRSATSCESGYLA